MCLTGSLLRNVLMVLLLTSCCGKRRCNYTEILDSYRDIVLTELGFLNLTASVNSSKTRDICPSGKAHHILASIYGATLQMQCYGSWKQLSDLEKPLKTMKELITDNCNPDDLRKKTVSCSAVRKIRGKKRMKIRLINVIKSVNTCWQKLLSMMVLSK